jgi:hypothetical protein
MKQNDNESGEIGVSNNATEQGNHEAQTGIPHGCYKRWNVSVVGKYKKRWSNTG